MISYRCRECKEYQDEWTQQCINCGAMNSIYSHEKKTARQDGQLTLRDSEEYENKPIDLDYVEAETHPRMTTVDGLDIVLGGGLVYGSIVLLAGPPGIGKSTLVLHALESLNKQKVRCLYVSGEERLDQIKMRADRLNIHSRGISVLWERKLEPMLAYAESMEAKVLVIDSVQTTVISEGVSGRAGSVNMVRAVAETLMHFAKDKGITIVLIGHIVKDGDIAGPKTLEHYVDATMFFEKDDNGFRLLRAEKNRYGDVSNKATFTMTDKGLFLNAYA